MEGTRVSHYEVLEQLGRGGMGVVYKALDTRLNRHVALKFLPPEMTSDDEARQRFTTEAQAASALDHPNICTIYEIDADPDGRMFIAMAFYDGETLKQRIDRGPLAINEALEIAVQMARGLAKAHAAGIVHRDVKPANVMITGDGLAKVLDFGIAKLTGATGGLTKTGSTLGTASYMSPEQVHAGDVGAGSDVWSLGAVLYEMLAGEEAFDAANAMALIYAITSEAPAPLRSLRPEVPAEVEAVVTRALEKAPADRFASAEEFASALEPCLPRTGTVVARPAGEGRTARWWGAAAVAAVALLAGGLWASGVIGGGDREWVVQVALPEIEALARESLYDSAWTLARRAEKVAPDEPALEEMWPLITWTMGALRTEPPGARVLRRPYGSGDDTPWELLGTTPLETFRLPYGNPLLKIEAEGYQASYLAPLGVGAAALTEFPLVTLDLEGEAPENMVRVPGLDVTIDGTAHALEDFYIDRFEVTNRGFKTFVDAGGYRDPQYWEHPFVLDGRTLSRDQAMEHFVDQTGRPGPSMWQVANYPDGQDDYPVTGVSWYEAAAYAKFAGKSLPSVHHWRRAYGTAYSLPFLLPRSNFTGDGPAPVGEYTGMGPFGTFDMAGNAREWGFNAVGEDRYMLGGGWTDPDYTGLNALRSQPTQPPFDRSATNGIRLARYLEEGSGLQAALAPGAARGVVDSPDIPTVDDEVFDVYRRAYAYDRVELNSTVEEADTTRHWIRQRISFDAAYGDERVLLYLYLPLTSTAPLQTVVYWGGSQQLAYTSIDQTPNLHPHFIVQSGRALALPVLKGTLERNDGFSAPWGSILQRERIIQQVQDVLRTVDYLATRDDIDADALAYYGYSWGSSSGPVPLALEPRLKAAILNVAGLWPNRSQPEVDPVFFVPRTSVPVLLLSGRLDAVIPLEASARLFDLLGTPDEQKHHVVSEAGHYLPMTEVIRESLDFLDRYLGPVGGG
ncbi:MAG: protein kinase [Gemmatimonadota bacterium]